jgi:hypothetical protein
MEAFLTGSAGKRRAEEPPAEEPLGVRRMAAPLAMQAFGRLPASVKIPDAPAPHFKQVSNDGERCELFVVDRNPKGLMRKWSAKFCYAVHGSKHGRAHPDTDAAKASQRFAEYEEGDATDDKELVVKMRAAGRGWMVEAPHGAGSPQARFFYGRVSGAKMLRSYAHFKGW